jgi:hypothetical protein
MHATEELMRPPSPPELTEILFSPSAPVQQRSPTASAPCCPAQSPRRHALINTCSDASHSHELCVWRMWITREREIRVGRSRHGNETRGPGSDPHHRRHHAILQRMRGDSPLLHGRPRQQPPVRRRARHVVRLRRAAAPGAEVRAGVRLLRLARVPAAPAQPRSPLCRAGCSQHAARQPLSTKGGTRLVHLVRREGRDLSG